MCSGMAHAPPWTSIIGSAAKFVPFGKSSLRHHEANQKAYQKRVPILAMNASAASARPNCEQLVTLRLRACTASAPVIKLPSYELQNGSHSGFLPDPHCDFRDW